MYRIVVSTSSVALLLAVAVNGFLITPLPRLSRVSLSLSSSTDAEVSSTNMMPVTTKELGLLTFDLDDTLYPILQVSEEANAGFVRAMERFGYDGVSPNDIVEVGKRIREEIGETNPEQAAALTHTEVREKAIRRVIEEIVLERKLQACADDLATQVSSLSPIVVESAKKWTRTKVSESVVQSVLSSWEMERHHAAERHLYPEVIDALKQIKEEHPNAIIGAVTDGRANPLLMTFTLAPYFDFCMSWEDEQGGRQKFFQELDNVDGNAELTWIYDAARHQYATLKQAADGMSKSKEEPPKPLVFPETYDNLSWIHVGDDLAFDVGGSSACGAKTILLELAEKYGQTARFRFEGKEYPEWSTTSQRELEQRIKMNEAATDKVNIKLAFLSQLPDAINDILQEQQA